MPAIVILSEAKNPMDSGTYTLEILRLTPQNDIVGQPLFALLPTFLYQNLSYWRKSYESPLH